MNATISVSLTLEQLETIADALEFTGECCEQELNDHAEGSDEFEGLSADLKDITEALQTVADAMELIVDDDEAP
jgi:hypothetical protein